MFRSVLLAGLAAAAFVPSLAQAQSQDSRQRCLEQKHDNRVVGTVLGGIGGALLGNAIGEHGGREGGTILGGLGGAVAGNAIGAGTVHCGSNQYGYYDDSGRWMPNPATAYGFYDADGRWIDTTRRDYAPPPPRETYAPPAPPRDTYGSPPPRDSYAPPAPPPYAGGDHWRGAPMDTRERERWLEDRIQRKISDGSLDYPRGRHALRELRQVQRMDSNYRGYDGRLSEDQRRDILARLDAVRADVWGDREDHDRQ